MSAHMDRLTPELIAEGWVDTGVDGLFFDHPPTQRGVGVCELAIGSGLWRVICIRYDAVAGTSTMEVVSNECDYDAALTAARVFRRGILATKADADWGAVAVAAGGERVHVGKGGLA